MSYGQILLVNINGNNENVDVNNEWVLANKPRTLLIQSTSMSPEVDEEITLSFQLRTPMLVDGTHENVSESETIEVQIGDVLRTFELESDGSYSHPMACTAAGEYEVLSTSHVSNTLTITATEAI